LQSSEIQQENAKRILLTREYKNGVETKTCSTCKLEKSIFKFKPNKLHTGEYILRAECRRCSRAFEKKYSDLSDEQKDGIRVAARLRRANTKYRASHVLSHMRTRDANHGQICDLDLATVKVLLSQPCSYCHRTLEKMTLDRKDNSLGHTRDNVVPACGLCNYVRMDMPYDAWLTLVPHVRELIIAGRLDSMCGSKFKGF